MINIRTDRFAHAFGRRGVRSSFILSCLLLFVVLFCGTAAAGPVLYDPETWDSGTLEDWQNTTGDGLLSNPGTYLNIRFGSQAIPFFEEDTIFINSALDPDKVGNFQNPRFWLTFSYLAEDVQAGSSVIYLHSSATNALWEYSFETTTVGSWQTINVNFSYAAGWIGPGGETEFWNDLATIDWIGINIARNTLTTIQQDFGIDDWEYVLIVPEPGTISVLSVALLGIAASLRKKRLFNAEA